MTGSLVSGHHTKYWHPLLFKVAGAKTLQWGLSCIGARDTFSLAQATLHPGGYVEMTGELMIRHVVSLQTLTWRKSCAGNSTTWRMGNVLCTRTLKYPLGTHYWCCVSERHIVRSPVSSSLLPLVFQQDQAEACYHPNIQSSGFVRNKILWTLYAFHVY